MIAHITLLTLLFIPISARRDAGREMRATRMSVVDFWKNETFGDGLNVRVAHGVNSWPALVDQLHEPFLNKSMMIEGDVFLMSHRRPRHRAIPVMRAETRVADRITFRDWIKEVASLHKAIKINFRSTEVVRPVLQYLYASQADPTSPVLQYPVILHANVFRSPRSIENPVDPETFVEKAKELFPDATLSLGWTRQTNVSAINPKFTKLSWRQLFEILEYIKDIEQPVMLSVRLNVASNSKEQLLWLLGMDKPVSLLIWSDEDDKVDDWDAITELRKQTTKNRILYDLAPVHRKILQSISNDAVANTPSFELRKWSTVAFVTSDSEFSGVVTSERGPVFLGKPAALLISEKVPPAYPDKQEITGKVHFMPKDISDDVTLEEKSGLVINLMDAIKEVESADIKDAIKVFIGYDGRISVENKADHKHHAHYERKAVTQLPITDCYGFRVTDVGWRVTAEVWNAHCSSHKSSKRRRRADAVRLELDTPFQKNGNMRNVVVTKTGDGAIDFMLEELHVSGSSATTCLLVTALFLLYRLL